MADTLSFCQVDGCDEVEGEEDAELGLVGGGSDGEVFAAEGVWHFPVASHEGDVALGGRHLPRDRAVRVVRFGWLAGHGSDAWPVAAGGHGEVQRLMRALVIVDVAPAVEGLLGISHGGEGAKAHHLRLEAAVKAFVLAPALRVIGP